MISGGCLCSWQRSVGRQVVVAEIGVSGRRYLAGCTVERVNWRGWYLIVGLILFGTPALVALGPLGVLLGVGAIVVWAINRYGK